MTESMTEFEIFPHNKRAYDLSEFIIFSLEYFTFLLILNLFLNKDLIWRNLIWCNHQNLKTLWTLEVIWRKKIAKQILHLFTYIFFSWKNTFIIGLILIDLDHIFLVKQSKLEISLPVKSYDETTAENYRNILRCQ